MLAALPAALHAVILLGRLHPDEVFQSLEIALNRTYGFGVVPWEWQRPPAVDPNAPWGIRNWAVPILFSTLLKFGDAVGITTVMGRRILIELPQFALHVAMLAAVWRMAFRRVGEVGARWCLWLVALYAPLVWFGGRTMSEAFSTAFLVWGLERLDARDVKVAGPHGGQSERRWPEWNRWLLGGVLLGCAQITRYGSAAAIVPAMIWLLVERRWITFAFATAGGAIAALALGALDWVTWGEPFHSLIHYVRYNVVSGSAAATFGAAPWWMYLPRLLLAPFAVLGLAVSVRQGRTLRPAVGVLAVALIGVALIAVRPDASPGLQTFSSVLGALCALSVGWLLLKTEVEQPSIFIASALGYLAILSATAHKEDRFIYPALILLTVAGAPLFVKWYRSLDTPGLEGLGMAAVAAGVFFYLFPSPLDVQRKEQFQFVARNAEATTGLVVMNEGMWGSPGFFYVGKNIPWCPCDFPHDSCFQLAARDGRFNRAVYWSNGKGSEQRDAQTEAAFAAAGFHVEARSGFATWFAR
ncbi:MAG: mannosyltransferase [Archangium sp.]|nr:mannosyltransferase [Archangium sp.]